MLIHAGNGGGTDDLTQAENKMIIGQKLRFRSIRIGESQHLRFEINGLNGAPTIVDVSTEMPDGIENVTWLDATRYDLRQQRLEEEVVLAADQDNLDGIILFDQAAKPARRLNASEPAAHDDDSDWWRLSAECSYYRILLIHCSHRFSRDISSKYFHNDLRAMRERCSVKSASQRAGAGRVKIKPVSTTCKKTIMADSSQEE